MGREPMRPRPLIPPKLCAINPVVGLDRVIRSGLRR